jgi:hypothetical protein
VSEQSVVTVGDHTLLEEEIAHTAVE